MLIIIAEHSFVPSLPVTSSIGPASQISFDGMDNRDSLNRFSVMPTIVFTSAYLNFPSFPGITLITLA